MDPTFFETTRDQERQKIMKDDQRQTSDSANQQTGGTKINQKEFRSFVDQICDREALMRVHQVVQNKRPDVKTFEIESYLKSFVPTQLGFETQGTSNLSPERAQQIATPLWSALSTELVPYLTPRIPNYEQTVQNLVQAISATGKARGASSNR